MMTGLMQNMPLLVSGVLEHARRWHGEQELVSLLGEGNIHRQSFRETAERASQLAHALVEQGVALGDRVGLIAPNSHRHLEALYAASGIGAVLHSINPRLSDSQIEFVIADAEDTILFVEPMFLPLAERILDNCPGIRHLIVMANSAEEAQVSGHTLLVYEDIIREQAKTYPWPELDEHTANALCHTSGTTGNPKGVLYSHRSNVLHSLGVSLKDAVSIGATDVILPMVPMFHANGWGMPYAALMHGAKLVFAGSSMDGATLLELVQREKVTVALGVPTVCLSILDELSNMGGTLSSLNRLAIAGSAAPPSMIETYAEYGVEVIHSWGMTETSPIGTANTDKAATSAMGGEQRADLRAKQGRPIYGVDLRIVDDADQPLPHDGFSMGQLQVRGLWVLQRYLNRDASATDDQSWFSTGDIATIDSNGYMQIVDRAKDVIKSGGEWISSVDLENMAMSLAGVSQAAAIGLPHPKWDERPLLVVTTAEKHITKEEVVDFLSDKVPRFWLPDDVVFVSELPLGATGKVQKAELRSQYLEYFQ